MRTYPISIKINYEDVKAPAPIDHVLNSTLTQDVLVSDKILSAIPDKEFYAMFKYGDAKVYISGSLVALADRNFIRGTEIEYLFAAFDGMYFRLKFDYSQSKGKATVEVYRDCHDLSCHCTCNHIENIGYCVYEND